MKELPDLQRQVMLDTARGGLAAFSEWQGNASRDGSWESCAGGPGEDVTGRLVNCARWLMEALGEEPPGLDVLFAGRYTGTGTRA
jgi:hypothetical protein